MLLSSILFIVNLINKNLKNFILIFLISIIYNISLKNNFMKRISKMKFMIFFFVSAFLMQIVYVSDGEIILQIWKFYITKKGILAGSKIILKIMNILLISWTMDFQKSFSGKFLRYQKIVKIVVKLVPEIFVLFKNKFDSKKTFKIILKKVYKEL